MNIYDIIAKKRDGGELTSEELRYWIGGVVEERIPEYQTAALLMAIYLRGMTDRETYELTLAMAESGEMLDLSEFGDQTTDKHSTGGVGDKVSLILIPVLAALGKTSVKMSGRGLGHTGGTLDKLESIPGCRTAFTPDEMLAIAKECGGVIAGQTERVAPADKKLYALRDVTGTVGSIPLIAASIMSKKLAGGNHRILLDVKVGSGAFMKTPREAKKLAQTMVEIGKRAGREVKAIITDMSEPLGNAVGNALEVKEAIAVLCGKPGKLKDEVVTAAALLLGDEKDARRRAEATIDSGAAFQKFVEILTAQGADREYLNHPERLPVGRIQKEVVSNEAGFLSAMDTEALGRVAARLGAGRDKVGDEIDPGAGFILHAKKGEYVEKGARIATLYTDDEEHTEEEAARFLSAITLSEKPPEKTPVIYKIIE